MNVTALREVGGLERSRARALPLVDTAKALAHRLARKLSLPCAGPDGGILARDIGKLETIDARRAAGEVLLR